MGPCHDASQRDQNGMWGNKARQEFTHLVQRTSDGVALGLANGGVALSSGDAGDDGDDGGLGEHVCSGWVGW